MNNSLFFFPQKVPLGQIVTVRFALRFDTPLDRFLSRAFDFLLPTTSIFPAIAAAVLAVFAIDCGEAASFGARARDIRCSSPTTSLSRAFTITKCAEPAPYVAHARGVCRSPSTTSPFSAFTFSKCAKSASFDAPARGI